jgi:hypothetical protein
VNRDPPATRGICPRLAAVAGSLSPKLDGVHDYCAARACRGSALTTEALPEVISSWIQR